MSKRRALEKTAGDRILQLAAEMDAAWALRVAAWRARYHASDDDIRERALRGAIQNNAWQPNARAR